MSEDAPDEARFLDLVAEMQAKDAGLTSVQAALLVAAEQAIARDSRTFSRIFGMAHALVLRELTTLIETRDLLHVTRRDERTMRLYYELAGGARAVIHE